VYATVRDNGLLLAEINPLVLDPAGAWIALDGKIEIDDNVVVRRPDLEQLSPPDRLSAIEAVARQAGLAYVELDGSVGLLANGAGLAMATMDLLHAAGLPAANFMDLGGGADERRMGTALRLLFDHPAVKVVFLNLFGGIVSCERVVKVLVQALEGRPPVRPLVLRLAGHGAEAGQALLESLGMPGVFVTRERDAALSCLRACLPEEAARSQSGSPDYVTPARIEVSTCRVDESDVRGVLFDRPAPEMLAAVRHALALDNRSRILVQGATGRAARTHCALMRDYGVNLMAGVTPFKGGAEVEGIPIFDSVRQALRVKGPFDAAISFVPAAGAADAILEAVENGIPFVTCITEGIAQAEMLAVREVLRTRACLLLGPNTPGLILPGRCKLGIMPDQAFAPGPVAILSRSGTLVYEIAAGLSAAGLGQSVCAGIGGDPFVGTDYIPLLEGLRRDPRTRAVLVVGEIGGYAEENLAAHIRATGFEKPLFGFIAGRTAPPGRRLGHAGAILDESGGGVAAKLADMEQAGIRLCHDLDSIAPAIRSVLAETAR